MERSIGTSTDSIDEKYRIGILAHHLAERAGLQAILSEREDLLPLAQSGQIEGLLSHIDLLDILILVVSESENISRVLEEIKLVLPISCGLLIITHAIDEISPILLGSGHIFGILSIEYSEEELLIAIRAVANGLIVISPQIAQRIFKGPQPLEIQTAEKSSLSSREMQVLDLLAQGLANKQIADRLGLRPNTVKFYVTTIYQKIGASNRAEAVTRAIQSGILSV